MTCALSSGRLELASSAAATSGRRLVPSSKHSSGGRRLAAPCGRRAAVVAAAASSSTGGSLGTGPNAAWKKYKSRQDLEVDYFKEWEETTVLAAQDAKHKMTALTLLAALPNLLRFYIVPAPIRFVFFALRSAALRLAYQLRKRAVLAGAKLDMATMQRRGGAARYPMRQTALLRLHGKESVFGPLRLMFQRYRELL